MDAFFYKNGNLHCEGVQISDISECINTPFYLYSQSSMEKQYKSLEKALRSLNHRIFFSAKANSNLSVLKIFKSLGSGLDIVSGGEYERAQAAGFEGKEIVFSGVGKNEFEIRKAISGGIRQLNIESEPELDLVNKIAEEERRLVEVSIRVNPDVDAKTHKKITTGLEGDKFGVTFEQAKNMFKKQKSLKWVSFVGLDMHIGSQISDINVFRESFKRLRDYVLDLRQAGFYISRLDVGGGIGIEYELNGNSLISIQEYAELLKEYFDDLDCEIELEPGRFLIGNAGILVTSVLYKKFGSNHNFLIIDAAMNDLIRPALYDARHELITLKEPTVTDKTAFNVVGPVCESGDTFDYSLELPKVNNGDLVAFSSAGAYGAVMASEYNSRPLVPEVLVCGKSYAQIRNRPNISEILSRDIMAGWLKT